MYVEMRTYTIQVAKAAEYFRNYEEFGMKPQLRHLPHMAGYYVTELGPLNQIIHMWAYDSLDQRDKCRAAMSADPDWKVYLGKNQQFILSQETKVMKCAPFFVERLKTMLSSVK